MDWKRGAKRSRGRGGQKKKRLKKKSKQQSVTVHRREPVIRKIKPREIQKDQKPRRRDKEIGTPQTSPGEENKKKMDSLKTTMGLDRRGEDKT